MSNKVINLMLHLRINYTNKFWTGGNKDENDVDEYLTFSMFSTNLEGIKKQLNWQKEITLAV